MGTTKKEMMQVQTIDQQQIISDQTSHMTNLLLQFDTTTRRID
jgi:hypothetical protein